MTVSVPFGEGEAGHALPLVAAVLAAAGVVVLGIGAANDSGVMAIVGGIVAAVGVVAHELVRHVTIDYEFFRRTSK